MPTKFVRLSTFVPAVLAFALPAANALGQSTTGTRTPAPPPAGPVHTDGSTGTDPQPIGWPPTARMHFDIK